MAWYGFSCKEKYNELGNYEGFRVQLHKAHIDVVIQGAAISRRFPGQTGNGTPWNPYAFYNLFKRIHSDLTDGWRAPEHTMLAAAPPPKQVEWYKNKVARYWCKSIHSEWLKMLQRMNKADLDVARALFVANINDGVDAGTFVLNRLSEVSREHRKDIIDFLPAAMLAEEEPSYFLPTKSTSLTSIMDDDVEDDEDDSLWYVESTTKGDEDWRGAYCHESCDHIPGTLTDTLKLVKPGTARHTVRNLKNVVVERVISSKPELIVYTQAAQLMQRDSFMVSTKDEILTSIKILNKNQPIALGKKLTARKTDDIIEAARFADNADLLGTQNIQRMTERMINKAIPAPIIFP